MHDSWFLSDVFEVLGRKAGVDRASGKFDGDGDVGLCEVAQPGVGDGGGVARGECENSAAVDADSRDVAGFERDVGGAVGVVHGRASGGEWMSVGEVARPAVRTVLAGPGAGLSAFDDGVGDGVGGAGVAQAVVDEGGDVGAVVAFGEFDVVDLIAGQLGDRCAGLGQRGQGGVEGGGELDAAFVDLNGVVGPDVVECCSWLLSP